MSFEMEIAKCVQKYAPQFNIKVCSPIIAQAILESASGTSEKAKHCNYFGLKYRPNRCPSSDHVFIDGSKEQKQDGSYRDITDKWFGFSSMSAGVKGYFEFINTVNYAKTKNETDPYRYLQAIKDAGYATSIKYVDNLMAVISKYDLTKYDALPPAAEKKNLTINLHAGHNPDGKVACGAVGIIKEATEARKVVNKLKNLLEDKGCTVYDCTCNDGVGQADVLNKIVKSCNAHPVDLDVSIHFNAGISDKMGNGKTTGTECLIYSTTSKSYLYAQKIVGHIAALGFRNRGVKVRADLTYLKKTKAAAILVECCFTDDADDCQIYNAEKMALAICNGILA